MDQDVNFVLAREESGVIVLGARVENRHMKAKKTSAEL